MSKLAKQLTLATALTAGTVGYVQAQEQDNDALPEQPSKYAQGLKSTFKQREDSLKTSLNEVESKLLETDKIWVESALNSYIYYASAIGAPEDRGDVWTILKQYEGLVKETKSQEGENWFRNTDTLIWAKLHLGAITGLEAKEQIETLFNQVSDDDWKKGIKKQMDMHDKRFPVNKVSLNIG